MPPVLAPAGNPCAHSSPPITGPRRRGLVVSLAALTLCACGGLPGTRPTHRISLEQLQKAVAARFPMRKPVAAGVELELPAPALRLMPEVNRVAAAMQVQASGGPLKRAINGTFDLLFALRYEPTDQTIRAHQLEVQHVQFPDLPGTAARLLQGAVPSLARQALGEEVVLYTLRPKDLATAQSLGVVPDTITVTPQGLLVGFAPAAGTR